MVGDLGLVGQELLDARAQGLRLLYKNCPGDFILG